MSAPLPSAPDVARLLSDLFGRDVTVKPGTAPGGPNAVAIYRGDEDQRLCACLADLSVAANVGAALTMVPAGTAADAVKSGQLSETLRENAYEVFNILAQLFNVSGHSHVRLKAVTDPLASPPEDVATQLAGGMGRIDLAIEIAGYGGGSLSILAA